MSTHSPRASVAAFRLARASRRSTTRTLAADSTLCADTARAHDAGVEVRFSDVRGQSLDGAGPDRRPAPRPFRRRCAIGMRIAEVLGLSSSDGSALFYALLLKDLSCAGDPARDATSPRTTSPLTGFEWERLGARVLDSARHQRR